jgi:hypothetical protein
MKKWQIRAFNWAIYEYYIITIYAKSDTLALIQFKKSFPTFTYAGQIGCVMWL